MAVGILESALKTLKNPNISFLISIAVAIGVVYTCTSPWFEDDSDDDLKTVEELSVNSPETKIRVKKRRIIKLVPEVTELSQKNQDEVSTEFLSFKFGGNISQLQSKIIYATTLKSKGTQTDFVLSNYLDSNLSSIEYREIKKNDPAEIGAVVKQKIVKPPRKHPPVSQRNKLYNSLYPEVQVICHDSDSKSVTDDYHCHDYLKTSTPQKMKILEEPESKKSFSEKSFFKRCQRMLNFNDFDLNINESESKSTLKCWSSITSALGSQPAGHSTLINVNLSGATGGGQDEDYQVKKVNKLGEKVFSEAKSIVVEMNKDERPKSRIINDNYKCQCDDFDLSVDKNKIDYSSKSKSITGFSKDLHQFMKDVKSYFKIPFNNYHNSKHNDDNDGWIKMSTLRRNTSMNLLNKINANKGCYSYL